MNIEPDLSDTHEQQYLKVIVHMQLGNQAKGCSDKWKRVKQCKRENGDQGVK